jgi:transcriptional regulator with XRE-family HTH domain
LPENPFGSYLKQVRRLHGKTQKELADAIGKHVMLISGMESGKNNPPPQREALIKMMDTLELDEKEQKEFLDMAALQKNTLPNDIVDYVMENALLRKFIRTAQQRKIPDSFYLKLIEIISNGVKAES